MAGDRLCQQWILHYIVHKAFREFEDAKCLSNRTVDFISAMLPAGLDCQGIETQMPKIYFLVVLCRMNDGEKVFVEYADGQETTVLEDMIPVFEKLVKCQKGKLLDDGLEMIEQVIKTEAVLVCCRQKDYERANEVYKRQWSKVSGKDKNSLMTMKSLLKDLIKSKADMSDQFKAFTYGDFQKSMIKYLDRVQKNFSTPFLLKTAETYLNNLKNYDKKLKELSYANKKFGRDDLTAAVLPEDDNNSCEEQSGKSKPRLRRLWNEQIKEKFGSSSPEKQDKSQQCSNTDNSSKRTLEDPLDNDSSEHRRKCTRLSEKSLQTSAQQDMSVSKDGDKQKQTGKSPQKSPQPSVRTSPKSPQPGTSRSDNQKNRESPRKRTDAGFKSPQVNSPNRKPLYRKNQGRPNRHEPANPVGQEEDTESTGSASSFDLQSVLSMSSTRRKWDEAEMKSFYDAVRIFGVGKWWEIRQHLGTTRTNVMLKDKWRNMVKSGDAERLDEKRKRGKSK